MVDILAKEDSLTIDFASVTSVGAGGRVSGLEAVMQASNVYILNSIV